MAFLIGGANTESAAYEIENSLRFNDGDSPRLNRTTSTATNDDMATLSAWVKRSTNDANQTLIGWNSGNGAQGYLRVFNSGNNLQLYNQTASETATSIITNAKFRDISAWYHVVVKWDAAQGTDTNRVKLYVNGVEQTLGTANYPPQNTALAFNVGSRDIFIGCWNNSSEFQDGYVSEFAFIDGQALAPTSFAETDDNGVWIPKEFKDDVTFGNNGFYLEFKQTGTSANSSGIGADTSGNDNHWTPTNLAAIDITTDTPTNNFATLNPLNIRLGIGTTFSDGNLQVQTGSSGSSTAGAFSTIAGLKNGKWYAEFKPTVVGTNATMRFGIEDTDFHAADGLCNVAASAWASNGNKGRNATDTSHGDSYDDNDIIGVAVDLDNGAIYFSKNGTWQNSSDPESGSSKTGAAYTDILTILPTGGYMFAFNLVHNNSQVETVQANFGNPIFSISSGNSDANGYGNFEYAVPSGYYALCTKNLAEYG
jgi:hypothetical protein